MGSVQGSSSLDTILLKKKEKTRKKEKLVNTGFSLGFKDSCMPSKYHHKCMYAPYIHPLAAYQTFWRFDMCCSWTLHYLCVESGQILAVITVRHIEIVDMVSGYTAHPHRLLHLCPHRQGQLVLSEGVDQFCSVWLVPVLPLFCMGSCMFWWTFCSSVPRRHCTGTRSFVLLVFEFSLVPVDSLGLEHNSRNLLLWTLVHHSVWLRMTDHWCRRNVLIFPQSDPDC